MAHQFLENPTAIEANAGHDWCPFIPVFGAPAEMFERGLAQSCGPLTVSGTSIF